MVKLTKIYTRGGDLGETSLSDGSRRSKGDLRIEAYGTVDELNATIGLIRLHTHEDTTKDIDQLLSRIQNDLFDLGADLSQPEKNEAEQIDTALRIKNSQTLALEKACDHYNETLADLTSFILPGGSAISAYMHLARTVTRRTERIIVRLAEDRQINQEAIKYLNRLSDLLFILGRYCNNRGHDDILWVPGANR